jgi:hypothetical protein
MKADADGKPLVGSGSMMLGVRPADRAQPNRRFDVPAVAGTDVVAPGDGGLSCYTDPAAILVRGGRLRRWSVESDGLPAGLADRDAGDPHRHLEPAGPMTLDQFQQALAGTRDLWLLEPGGVP